MPGTSPRSTYDDVPYPSHPHSGIHPNRLAAVATLLGLSPARPDRCRVLELGCANGGNLIPLAYAYPQSRFLGVDLSPVQVRQGEELREALGLKNVELRAMSILDIDDGLGTFDFIICHGVYSWVPGAVQDKILEICARQLGPQGVGLVSYNTYPGWHNRDMIRGMMRLHERRYLGRHPQERIDQSRALLDLISEAIPRQKTLHKMLLREARDHAKGYSDTYLFHEYLEECNEPLYFLDFCERLAARGLRYLGEAELGMMVPALSFPPNVRERLQSQTSNLLDMEQYMDFLRNRLFRQTLVGQAGLRTDYEIRANRVAGFHLASMLRPSAPEPDLASDKPEEFTSGSVSLTSPVPVVKAALACLGENWPRPVAFDDLLKLARSRLPGPVLRDPAVDAHDLSKALLTAFATAGGDVVEFWVQPPPALSNEAGLRPYASHLARLQVAGNNKVSNLRHESVSLSAPDAYLLRLLDGNRDRAELFGLLLERHREGEFGIPENGQPLTEPSHIHDLLSDFIDQALARLVRASLLIA